MELSADVDMGGESMDFVMDYNDSYFEGTRTDVFHNMQGAYSNSSSTYHAFTLQEGDYHHHQSEPHGFRRGNAAERWVEDRRGYWGEPREIEYRNNRGARGRKNRHRGEERNNKNRYERFRADQRMENYKNDLIDSIKIESMVMPELYFSDEFSVSFNQMWCNGLFLQPGSSNFYFNEQLFKVMLKYKDSLISLKACHKTKLKTPKDYTNSILRNEDGFFLNLFSYIRECQILIADHMRKYFSRQRREFILEHKGFLFCPLRAYIRMVTRQSEMKETAMSIIYHNAFEFFQDLDEKVFREKVVKEMEVVQQKIDFGRQRFHNMQYYAQRVNTNFSHIFGNLQSQRRSTLIGHEIISNRMVYKYLETLKNLRFQIKSLQQMSSFEKHNPFLDHREPSKPVSAFDMVEEGKDEELFDPGHIRALLLFDYMYQETGIGFEQIRLRVNELFNKLFPKEKNTIEFFAIDHELLRMGRYRPVSLL